MRKTLVFAITGLCLALAGAARLEAQSCALPPEDFRFELQMFVADLEALYPLAEARDPTLSSGLRPAVEELDRVVGTLTAEELEQMCDLFTRYPELREAPGLLAEVLPSLPPLEGIGEPCQGLTREQYLAAFIATQILKGLEVIGKAVCDASACPLYTGAVVCAPTPPECTWVCPLTLGIAVIARIISESYLITDDNCGLVNHYGAVEEFADQTDAFLEGIASGLQDQVLPALDEAVSSRASQAGLDGLQAALATGFGVLDGGLDGLLAELAAQAADREAFQELDQRLRIEASLQAGAAGPLSTLQLPEALGGQLERVREIVADTILMNLAAGQEIHGALELFDKGDEQLNLQNYKWAFQAYRLAYRAAASEGPAVDG